MIALVEAPPMTPDAALRQLIEDHREQAKDGHDRLRKDVDQLKGDTRALDDRIERVFHDQVALARRVDALQLLQQVPPNIDKMAWTTKQMIGIVGAVMTGVLIVSAETYALQLNITQVKSSIESTVKIQDERNANLEKQLAAALAESRLNGLKTDDLSKQLTTYLLQHTK